MKTGFALTYDGIVPRIAASAEGELVSRMLELARTHDIPVLEDPDLAESLSVLNTGESIPEELYIAVSEILAQCYQINKKFRDKMNLIGLHNNA